MYASNSSFKIVVLEDSHFYNDILTQQLNEFTKALSIQYKVDFIVNSYIDSENFLLDLRDDIDIIFTDYYLGNQVSAKFILQKVNEICQNCEVVVLSQNRNSHTVSRMIENGANKFIYKDKNTLTRVCFYLENYVTSRLSA